MMPRGQVLSTASLLERAAVRRAVGKLRTRVIQKATLKRYKQALCWLFLCFSLGQIAVPKSEWEMDAQVGAFIDMAWQEGEPRNLVGDMLSGLSYFIPPLRGKLGGSWRLYDAWGRSELPARAPPLTPLMATALCGYLLNNSTLGMSVAFAVMFHCYLRTTEMLSIVRKDVSIALDGCSATLVLPSTKSGARNGGMESVVVNDPIPVRLLMLVVRPLSPRDRMTSMSRPQLRALFDAALWPQASTRPLSLTVRGKEGPRPTFARMAM